MARQFTRSLALRGMALSIGLISAAPVGALDAADTMHLTDQPGNWFCSERTGTPVSVVGPGDRVDFKINDCCTNTRHTVTLLVKPDGSAVEMDQDQAKKGTLSVDFDVPGVYVFVCKVHPYMTAVVAVTDENGQIPDVTATSLPFLEHLGAASLPADVVLSVMTTVAPTDADKLAKWDILGPEDEVLPSVPGVGEVWLSTQFERVPGQADEGGVPKPGTITVIDAATFTVEREIDGRTANGLWNNPHNMWADFSLDSVYNSNWFGKWINKIDRVTGEIVASIEVGEAPTHIITIPTEGSGQEGILTIPLSADNDFVKVEDMGDRLRIVDSAPTGDGHTHPHGHWLTCGEGDRAVVPNVFKGLGFAGSISILDSISGDVLAEFEHDPNDPLLAPLLMPLAAGECHVHGIATAYVANLVSGYVTVINVDQRSIITNIPVTLTPDGLTGLNLLHTLQGPIQTPVSPDEKWVATAVLSLTTVPRSSTGSPDHVALIDTSTNRVVKFIPTPAGTHGVNWGAKLGGGYYAYVTNQHANVLTVIDPDPNGDGDGSDGGVVGTILLANGSEGAGPTDGTGGQGVKPLPLTHDGWIQKTVAMSGTGSLSAEVEGWISLLTEDQRNPEGFHLADLTDLTLSWGMMNGDLDDLRHSDDERLRGRSGFRFSANEPNVFEIKIGATSESGDPEEFIIAVESMIDSPGGLLHASLKNWETGKFEAIGRAQVGLTEAIALFRDVATTNRIRPTDGRIELRLRWSAIAAFDTRGFEIEADEVRIGLH